MPFVIVVGCVLLWLLIGRKKKKNAGIDARRIGLDEGLVILDADFMSRGMWLQPLLAVVIGLIPNCASSVMITEMFVSGALVPGAAVAGLTVNAGLGLAVLFRENKDIRANLGITLGLVAYALAAGYIITAIGAAA